ncbi:MAG: SDR family oxidoreductase [Caulobacteraceae bacterium]
MADHQPRLIVTGASGQLGALVVERLLETVPAGRIVALARNLQTVEGLAARGVQIRAADYARPETLDTAFQPGDRVLLISSNALGQRVAQHDNVIRAAARAGVGLLAYTSILHADASPLGLAEEHRPTEAALKASGLPFVILRNGWYAENYTAAMPAILAHGAVIGSAGDGRISFTARADYAAAAAAVLTSQEDLNGRVFELAGDAGHTLAEFATEIGRQTGRPIPYRDLPEADYAAALVGAGLPEEVAKLLADSHVGASRGVLFDDSRELSRLIGRPTTPLARSVAEALARS